MPVVSTSLALCLCAHLHNASRCQSLKDCGASCSLLKMRRPQQRRTCLRGHTSLAKQPGRSSTLWRRPGGLDVVVQSRQAVLATPNGRLANVAVRAISCMELTTCAASLLPKAVRVLFCWPPEVRVSDHRSLSTGLRLCTICKPCMPFVFVRCHSFLLDRLHSLQLKVDCSLPGCH